MIERTSGASRFNIDKFSEVLGLRGMKKVVRKKDNFVVDALIYFEPVQRFEYRGDYVQFWSSSYCASKGVLYVTGDEIFVFAVSLGKVSYNSLIKNVQEK